MSAPRLVLVAAGVIASLALSGCTGGDSAAPPAAKDSTFTYALPYPPSSLDLTRNYDVFVPTIISTFLEGLERMQLDGSLGPLLATAKQPDPTTIVYDLQPGVKFSNGDQLTADDVVYSIDHTFGEAALKAGAQTATSLFSIAKVVKTGPTQVTVTLQYPDPTARAYISLLAFVQSKKFAEANAKDLGTPAAVPIGTGPYKVATDTASGITLDRNPTWRGPAPYADRIAFNFIGDDRTAQLALQSGSIQAANVGNLANIEPWKSVAGSTLYTSPSLLTYYVSMDTKQAPFDDLDVRRAIAYATDATGLAKAAFGSNATVQQGLLPVEAISTLAGSAANASAFLGTLPRHDLDLAKAKAALAASKHAGGFTMEIPYTEASGAWAKLTALNLAANLSKIGITATAKVVTSDELSARNSAHKDLGVVLPLLVSVPPDPNGGLVPVVGAQMATPGGLNYANWTTPTVEKALPVLTGSPDPAARWKATQTILTEIANDVPYVPLFTPDVVYVVGPGYTFTANPSVVDFFNGSWVFLLGPAGK